MGLQSELKILRLLLPIWELSHPRQSVRGPSLSVLGPVLLPCRGEAGQALTADLGQGEQQVSGWEGARPEIMLARRVLFLWDPPQKDLCVGRTGLEAATS